MGRSTISGALVVAAMVFSQGEKAAGVVSSPIEFQSPGAASGPYKGFGYEWENNSLGMEPGVPPPFTPVEVDGTTVGVWGREFDFDGRVIPQQVESQKRKVLAGPVAMDLQIGGHPVEIAQIRGILRRENDERAVVHGEMAIPGGRVTVETSVEFDGFTRMDLTVSPDGAPLSLDRLAVEIPMSGEAAQFFNRGYEYDFVEQRSTRFGIEESTGKIDASKAFAFNSHLCISGSRVGLDIAIPTNYEWSNRDADKAMEITPRNGDVLVRLNMVDKPRQISGPTTFSFAVFPVPIKPSVSRGRTTLPIMQMSLNGEIDPALWNIVTFRPGPTEMLPLKTPLLPQPPESGPRRDQWQEAMEHWKTNGVGVIPYAGVFLQYVDVPEWQEYHPWWFVTPEGGGRKGFSEWKFETASIPGVKGAVFPLNLYPKSARDWLIWQLVTGVRDNGYAGIYLDLADTTDNHMNPLAGEYVGNNEKYYKPVYEIRDFYKRLYKALKGLNPDYLINVHHGKVPVVFSSFADIVTTGEGVNAVFYEKGEEAFERGELPDGHYPYLPDYSLLGDDYWLGAYGVPIGPVQLIMPHVLKWNPFWSKTVTDKQGKEMKLSSAGQAVWYRAHPDVYRAYTRGMLARTLVLDLPLLWNRCDLEEVKRLYVGYQKHLGALYGDMTHIGPADAGQFLAEQPGQGIHAAALVQSGAGKAVVILANWSREEQSRRFVLNPSGLRLGAGIGSVTDLEDGTSRDLDGNAIELTLPANDFRVLLVEP
jgi:hypothetical protein